jgi:hypothetical protein
MSYTSFETFHFKNLIHPASTHERHYWVSITKACFHQTVIDSLPEVTEFYSADDLQVHL